MIDIDWTKISPEDFESLCVCLLYREGYRNIIPLGSRGVKEEGKDAIEEQLFRGMSQDSRITIFQFKRWTADYTDNQLKGMIKKELDEKVILSGEKIRQYILITCHPLTTIKEWFRKELSQNYKFQIHFFEKTWLENRLNTDSQDLRRKYFGIDIERHSIESLKETCNKQVRGVLSFLKSKYIPNLYVNREIEKEFKSFLASDKSCFVVVDRSGRGKTNLFCHLAESLSKRQPVIFVFGNKTITTDNDLIAQITTELGYAGPNGTRWQADMDDLERVLSETHSTCLLFIDGISENNNIVAMKNAIRELLLRYGNKTHFKFCFSCRDIFWMRFAIEFKGYIFLTQDQKISAGDTHLGVHLKDWSNSELDIAIKKYKAYFKIQFSLTPDVKNQCKYPLLFRLFCETYSHQSIGLVSKLPLYQVFEDYLNTKINRIADYLNLSFPPSELFSLLQNVRERMWTDDDTQEIKKSELIKILVDMYAQNPYDILERMLDEGLFLQISNAGDTFIRFSFDELADYLLYLVFMNDTKNSNELKIRDIIGNQVRLLENDDQKIKAEKFLVLISRSLENSDDINFLLETTLDVDLFIFSQCCWQRILLSLPVSKTDLDIVEIFSQKLIHYYGQIIERYFLSLHNIFTPFDSDRNGVLGLRIKSSEKIREINYSYKLQTSGSKLIESELSKKFPTWSLSINDKILHDPEGGIMVPYLSSSPWGPLRTVDFEWDSPFSGVSIMAPDRLALYDIRQEIKKILDLHKIDEQSIFLPKPDLPIKTDELWKEYSEQQLFDYMVALFSHFIHIYQDMIKKKFPEIASRMNLYNQYPVHCVILIDKERDFIKLFLAPTEGEDPEIQAKYLPDGISLNVPNGGLRLEGDIPFEAYTKKALKDSKRYKTNSYPIEKTIALKELFGDTPINTLLYQWLLSELTDILQVPIFTDDI